MIDHITNIVSGTVIIGCGSDKSHRFPDFVIIMLGKRLLAVLSHDYRYLKATILRFDIV
jgi:hypothetical protein